jgi:flagellar hook assembly protein FlgD
VKARSYALELHQNYPNPFNPTTTITFTLPRETPVNLSLYALDGTRVRTLIDRVLPAGSRDAFWDGTDDHGNPVSSGVYFCRLRAGKRALARKMVYLK